MSVSDSKLCTETKSLQAAFVLLHRGMLEACLHVLHQTEQENKAGLLLGRRVPLPGGKRHICGCCKAVSILRNTHM